jgi:predicted phage-related endonuclease
VQGTEEWFRERLGTLSASRMHRVVNGTPKGWQSLMAELYREKNSPDHVLAEEPMYSEDAEHGKEYEDAARAEAELALDVDIIPVGFARHKLHQWLGASVDGLILKRDEEGLASEIQRCLERTITPKDLKEWIGYVWATVEIKCFTNLTNHAYVWTNKRVLDKYLPQVHTQNLVFGTPRSIFVSYHEQMPDPKARTAIVELARDESYQRAIMSRAFKFNSDFQMYCQNGGNLPILASNIPQRF